MIASYEIGPVRPNVRMRGNVSYTQPRWSLVLVGGLLLAGAANQSDHEANRAIGQRARRAKRYSSDTSVALENAMKSIAKRKEEANGKPTPKRPPTLDEMLDEALDETFPASDAVALTAPSKTGRTRAGAEKLAARKGA